mmetsp:Transcript_16883/g.38855  ORF Transcript_16883/g.38855 Transcript_16883/m.38855 type:complete len:104 (-) Transcript_16883:95-406(-)
MVSPTSTTTPTRICCCLFFAPKKFPAGRPNTDQVDEDMAMWFEDKDGKQKKALSKPVGGRPVNLYTKNQLQDIEAKGVDPFEKIKAFGKFLTQKPKAGDKWRQ